jgi:hypothetical protein
MESSKKASYTNNILRLKMSQILRTTFVDTLIIKANEEDSAVPELSDTGTDLNTKFNFI